uniref:Uncharacterized protein n=1 Tax=Rhizophora mucronata TaxID=61149 RepID=A0A2P2QTF1_RHIMU
MNLQIHCSKRIFLVTGLVIMNVNFDGNCIGLSFWCLSRVFTN